MENYIVAGFMGGEWMYLKAVRNGSDIWTEDVERAGWFDRATADRMAQKFVVQVFPAY